MPDLPRTPPPPHAKRAPASAGWRATGRSLAEAVALLAVAVMVAHAFLVEGYVISSGSMAPGLFGYHKRVVCPDCTHTFARGVAFDGSVSPSSYRAGGVNADSDDGGPHLLPVTFARCPNCGREEIDVSAAPDTQGDQLLVLKHAFAWRGPRRWEVVVFRHPDDARQAYVKRVVGTPGERVRVAGGDVYADGELCRKPFPVQRAVRIPVFDPAREPETGDSDWSPRWSGGGWARTETDADDGPAVRFATPAAGKAPDDGKWHKLVYRHTLRSGGTHDTTVVIDPPPRRFAWDVPRLPRPYSYDPATHTLTCRGVLSRADRCRLRRVSRDPRWRAAVDDLAEASRFAPVTDDYGYNAVVGGPLGGPAGNAVRDFQLALSADLSRDPAAAVGLELTDGTRTFLLVADRADDSKSPGGTLSLYELGGGGKPLGPAARAVALPAAFAAGPVDLEFSLFDRRASAAAGGVELFAPVPYRRPDDGAPPGPSPATVGGRGAVTLSDLLLYRDVHYTRGRAAHGVEEDYELGPGELFVLGDNSPVSLDSRGWEEGAVPERLLVGKPFVVHLPSRPGTLSWGETETTVRIPDPSRIRYVR